MIPLSLQDIAKTLGATLQGDDATITAVTTDSRQVSSGCLFVALQGERFDPDGAYVKRYVPELARVPAAVLHKAWTLKPSEQATFGIRDVYARPVLDLAKTRDAALAAYASIKRL